VKIPPRVRNTAITLGKTCAANIAAAIRDPRERERSMKFGRKKLTRGGKTTKKNFVEGGDEFQNRNNPGRAILDTPQQVFQREARSKHVSQRGGG